MDEVLSLFHHIHHQKKGHEVHHCGGKHVKVNSRLGYTIKHCSCGKHRIDKQKAIGHATDVNLQPIEITVFFSERCPEGGWHIEGGKKA